MKRAILYLLLWLAAIAGLIALDLRNGFPQWLDPFRIWVISGAMGVLGGILYCLRAVYLSVAVRRDWDDRWLYWYFLRPFASLISGFLACLFLKAGLIALGSTPGEGSPVIGFYALAAIAGLNVDRFVAKIEDVAQATWGIKLSRAARGDFRPYREDDPREERKGE
ncbi:MAG: hypothetical protein KAY24_18120 [Candidatus Eisenbacteria sp.]|nr:hypothetical protein [Candidatus Eisenbacteria bacterium]